MLMNRSLSKIAVFSLILTFSSASILCCHSKAEASSLSSLIKAQQALPPCHTHKAKTSTPVKNNCDCCVTKQSQADSPISLSSNVPQVMLGYLSSNFSLTQVCIKNKFNLAYLDGPPGPIAEIPLYLQSHNFRI